MTFNLTIERLNAGLSIPDFATAVGVSDRTIRRLESGAAVHPSNAKKVADFFGVKVTDLMPIAERDAA
jgi:predicted transcriptional regulator